MVAPAPTVPSTATPRRRRGRGTGEVPLIFVSAGPDLGPGQTALWERDARHPRTGREDVTDTGGEVTVKKGGPPMQVARTGLVLQKLASGDLVEVDETVFNDLSEEYETQLALRQQSNAAIRERDREKQRQTTDAIIASQARQAALSELSAANERILQLESDKQDQADRTAQLEAALAEMREQVSGLRTATTANTEAPGSPEATPTTTTTAAPTTATSTTTAAPTNGSGKTQSRGQSGGAA
jgi:hypothetical protein